MDNFNWIRAQWFGRNNIGIFDNAKARKESLNERSGNFGFIRLLTEHYGIVDIQNSIDIVAFDVMIVIAFALSVSWRFIQIAFLHGEIRINGSNRYKNHIDH